MEDSPDAKFSIPSLKPECLLIGYSVGAFGLLIPGTLGLYENFWNIFVFAAWIGLGFFLAKHCTENPDGFLGRLIGSSEDDDTTPPDVPEWLMRSREIEARNYGTLVDEHAPAPAAPEAKAAPKKTAAAAPKPEAKPVEVAAPEPAAPAPEPAPAADAPIADVVNDESKPELLSAARDGAGDDLTRIKGVGPKLAKMLNEMGIHHFDQIAGWSDDNLKWVDENLVSFKGRASRDNWIDQAKELMAS